MNDQTNAQTLAGLAEGQATPDATPAETPKPETEQPNSTVTELEAAKPNGEAEQTGADDDAETEGQDDRPRKRSRSERYKSKIAAQAAQIAELQQRLTAGEQPKDAPKPPRPEDFQNYNDYEDARAAFNTQQAVNKALSESRKQENQTRLQEARAELVDEFMEGVASIKERIPDFDSVMDACKVDLRGDISDLILSSEKGPHLAYELAKNNGAKLRELHSMSATEAARAIGRMEARLSLPQPKKQTQAPTPIKPPIGGAAPSRDAGALAKNEDVGDYIAAMNAKERRA